MKRWFSLLLALVLACAHLPAPLAAAFAEESQDDLSVELVEAAEEENWDEVLTDDEVPLGGDVALENEALETDLESDVTLAPAENAGEELVFDLGDMTAEDLETAEATAEPETAPATARYGCVAAGEAPVYAGAGDDEIIAWAAGDAVVLLSGAAEEGRAPVAFDTERGIVEGWMDEAQLTLLSDEEISNYMDTAAENGPVSLYDDDPDMPLCLTACRFPEAEEAQEPESAAEDDVSPAEAQEPVEAAADDASETAQPAEDGEPEDSEPMEAEPGDAPEAPVEEVPEEIVEEVEEEQPAPEAPVEEVHEETVEEMEEEQPAPAEDDPETADPEGEDDAVLASEALEEAFAMDAYGVVLPQAAEGSFELNSKSVSLAVGETWLIKAADADGKEIPAESLSFSSSSNYISVDASGCVTAVAPGAAQVDVSYNNEIQSVSVTVLNLPASVTLSPSAMTIGEGLESPELRVTFEAGTGAQYSFSSSNPTVAEVDDRGSVYGVAEGQATITVFVSNTVTASCVVTVEKAPERVTLNTESLVMGEGDDSCKLTAQVPQNAHQEPLDWSSSDDSVVSVDDNGHLTANKVSEDPVTITVKTYNKKAAKCSVIVTNAPETLSLNGAKNLTMYKGQKLTPACSAVDANNVVCDVAKTTFNSDHSSIVAVDAAGTLTAKAEGTATITATAYNGVATTMVVTVMPAVNSLKLAAKSKPSTGYLGVGQTWSGWQVTKNPSNAYPYTYTYSSTNSSILKVTNATTGAFKAMKVGTAYIVVTSANGKSAKYKFVVKKAPTKLSLSPAKGKLKAGKSARYKFSLNGAGGSYTFTSSNPKVATVSASGKVKALKAGTAKITLKTYNGKRKTVTLRVYARSYPGLPGYLASTTSSYRSGMSREQKLEYVIYVAQNRLGCKYVWGNFGPSKFDCSGFTYYCFGKVGVKMQNSAYRQGYLGNYKKIKKISQLRRGDLVCFNTSNDGDLCDHVGIYLGNGYFIHASSSAGKVIISQFKSRSSNYYQRNFSWGRRIL